MDDNAACPAGQQCANGACACLPANLCNGVCVDLTSDSQNCGACGVACGGGTACISGNCLTTLVSGQTFTGRMAINATSVFWLDADKTVTTAPLGGGPATKTGAASADFFAVDAVNIYWVASGAMYAVPIAGGTTTTLAAGITVGLTGIAVDATSAYTVDGSANVLKIPLAGGAPVTLGQVFGSPTLGELVLDATRVYVTAQYSVEAFPVGGGPIASIGDSFGGGIVTAIGVNGTGAFWTASQGQPTGATGSGSSSSGGGPSISLMTAPFAGGPQSQLWYEVMIPSFSVNTAIAVDATSVYWMSGDGRVLKVPVNNGNVTTIASGQQGGPQSIAVDATSVYWTTTVGGTVMRAPK